MFFTQFISTADLARVLAFMSDLVTGVPPNPSVQVDAGRGKPMHSTNADAISIKLMASFADDLERLSGAIGIAPALARMIANRDRHYPCPMVGAVRSSVERWQLRAGALQLAHGRWPRQMLPLELMADLFDLQQTWLRGHSRRVADAARHAAAMLGLAPKVQQHCYHAGLIHGIGRAAIHDSVWNNSGPVSDADREQMRLAPYWTLRALHGLNGVNGLEKEVLTASYIGERLDGSGNFRGCVGREMALEAQILAAASAWISLRSPRPWRPAYSDQEAGEILSREATAGRFHVDVADVLRGMRDENGSLKTNVVITVGLTEREIEVLGAISQGQTNKGAARLLGISPRTVGTHLESAFKKLGCTTRAQASLKAQALRII